MNDQDIQKLKDDVSDIGEVHAAMDGHEKDLEIRSGQVDWGATGFTLNVPGHGLRRFGYDNVLDWYEPDGMWD